MTPEVETAVEEIKRAFVGHDVQVTPEAQGGAYVLVEKLDIGTGLKPTTSWCGFLITFQYPTAEVYPHFIDGAVIRANGSAFPSAVTGPTEWQKRSALQVSRKSKQWNPASDTAATKLIKVLEWLRSL